MVNYRLISLALTRWNYRLLSDREWSGRNTVALSAGVNGIYLSRANLDVAFDDSDRQINRKRLARTVLIFTESSEQLSRATDRVPGLPASPGYAQ